MRVLLAGAHSELDTLLTAALKKQGYTVDYLDSPISVCHALSNEHFDALLLDFPYSVSFSLLQQLRRQHHLPIMLLTSPSTPAIRIAGLNAGADDCLSKPIAIGELQVRLNAVIRRSSVHQSVRIHYKNIMLDFQACQVTLNNKLVPLSHGAFKLLQYLLTHQGQVVSHEQLRQTLYGWGKDIKSNTLEVYIHSLRKKLGHSLIQTVYRAGYRISN